MKLLFFDTETTGLPKDWRVHPRFFQTWPHLVTLSWRFYEKQTLLHQATYVFRPHNYVIPEEATKIHGYTTDKAVQEGLPSQEILPIFFHYVEKADQVIAHNASFDLSVIQAECYRLSLRCPLKQVTCTMKSTTQLCCLSSPRGYKYPKLPELYVFLFQKEPSEPLHSSATDTLLLAHCFFALQEKYPDLTWERVSL